MTPETPAEADGIKNIKRVGVISFAERRPRDYRAEQGYDWFAGH